MKKTIAIWAPLRYANYGDDLQAIAFGKMIQEMGYDVKLFQLEESLAERFGMKSAKDVDELCKDVNLCIIAGGALLTPFSLIKRMLHKSTVEYEKDFRDLFAATKKYNVKFCALSMGGDGMVRDPKKYYGRGRRHFFSSDAFIDGTVRLAGDVNQMKKQFGKNFTYYPDMLFRSLDFVKPDLLPPTTKYRVGINFKKGKYLDKKLLDDIFSYAETHDDIEFHFTTTHMDKIGLNYQYVPDKESKNIFIDKYEHPGQMLGVLASMDIFITSMLHLGLTGMVTGTPFISYRGPGKTKTFLKSVKGDWAIVDDNISFEQLRNAYFTKSRSELYNRYDTKAIEGFKVESKAHYDFCKNIIKKYG